MSNLSELAQAQKAMIEDFGKQIATVFDTLKAYDVALARVQGERDYASTQLENMLVAARFVVHAIVSLNDAYHAGNGFDDEIVHLNNSCENLMRVVKKIGGNGGCEDD